MTLAVVPVLFGPLQVLLALLPGLLVMLGGALLALFKPSTFKQSLRLFWRLKWPLLAGAAMLFGGVMAIRSLRSKPTALQAETATVDWPQFRGGPQRLGSVPGSPLPLSGGLNWSFASEMKTFYSSPAVLGNRVYCTGSNKGAFSDRGAVYCLDADTGALVWQSAPEGFRSTFSSPSISGKYLIVGEGLHEIKDACVVCLDISQQGKVLWSHRTKSHVESSACIAGDRVCIGAGDDGYYCFALEPGPDGKAKVLWRAPGEKYPDAECSPAYHDGKFYVGLGLRGNALVCLDAKSGAEVWRVSTPYPVFTPPTITKGKIVFGMGNGNFIENADQAALKELSKLKAFGATEAQLAESAEKLKAGGEVWCIDLLSAKPDVLWRYKTAEVVLGSVAAADDGTLYFGARDGFIYALAPDGKELKRWNARAPILASPSLSGDYLYTVNENGKVSALDRHTLEPAWYAAVGGKGPILSSPAVARGHLYIGTMSEGLVSLGVPGEPAAKQSKVWAGALGGAGKPGYLGDADLPEKGSLIWRWSHEPIANGVINPPARINAPGAILNNLLCLPMAEGEAHGLIALNIEPAASSEPTLLWRFDAPNGIWLSPAIVPEENQTAKPAAVLCIDGKAGSAKRQLHCLNANDGKVRWQAPIDADSPGEFSVLGKHILIQRGKTSVACLDMNGLELWKNDLGTLAGPPAHQHQLAALAFSSSPKLAVVDLPTGRELWSIEVGVATGPIIDKNSIYVGTASGVQAFALLDGKAVWSAATAPPAQPLVLCNGKISTVTAAGDLLIIDARTGKLSPPIPGANPIVAPLLTADAVFFVAGKENIMRASLTDLAPERWMTAARLGAVTAPIIAADGYIFFSTEKSNLIKAGRTP